MATDAAMDYANRLLENDYVQDKLREAGAKFGDARKRASKRRVDPATDDKLRAQVSEAVGALGEAASALRAGRTKPKPSWGKRLAVLAGVGTAGAAVALALSDDLREKLFGGDSETVTGSPDPEPAPERAATAA